MGSLLYYFVAKDLFKEGLTARYLFLCMFIASSVVFLRLIAGLVDINLGSLIFRISLFGMPFIVLLTLLFIELLAFGKNYYFRHIPLYILLGFVFQKIWVLELEPIGSGLELEFEYNFPFQMAIFYLVVGVLYIVYSLLLIVRVSRQFGKGLRSGFLLLISLTTTIMFIYIGLISANLFFGYNIMEERYVYAFIGSTMGFLLSSIIIFYPRALALAPIKLFSVQLFEKNSNIELYSKVIVPPHVDIQLINQFLSALTAFSKEALHGGFIKSVAMENAYIVFEVSEHFIAIAMAQEYHYNVRVLLKNILSHAEQIVRKRTDLLKQIYSNVIDVTSWQKALEEMVDKEIFSI